MEQAVTYFGNDSLRMPTGGCSAVISGSVYGRNYDFWPRGYEARFALVQARGSYASIGGSHQLTGRLDGMNEHGLTLVNMEVRRGMILPRAMPYTLLYRMVLERCKTVDEAVALLAKTPRQTANNLMLMDAAGNRAVVEITPEKVVVRRGAARAALISTNHQRGEDQDTTGQCWRYDTLNREAKKRFRTMDVATVEKMLGGVAQGKATLQSMVFEPANRVIYLATGGEATKRGYQKVDLKEYFRKSPND
jgi:predicted choloylglycine hydrolase